MNKLNKFFHSKIKKKKNQKLYGRVKKVITILCSCKMVNIFKQQLTTKPDRKEFTNNLDPNDATKTH